MRHRDECGHPADDGSGKVCRRLCAPGRGGHWYADSNLPGALVRESTARWIVGGDVLVHAMTEDES